MSTATAVAPDHGAAFEARFVHALNEAGMLLMTSIGHRTGLFAALEGAPPLTSGALAQGTGLNERYVREWLGAMVAGGVVTMEPAARTYRLPAAHAALLTGSGGTNLAVYAQFVPMMGQVEEDIIRCFRDGGGVPYERYPRFHEVMAEDSGQTVLGALFEHILPLAPELPARLLAGIRVLDVGCGRGRALMLMAERYPQSHFTGYDLCLDAIDWAAWHARERRLDNVSFEARDLCDFDRSAEARAFDLVTTFDAIHDQGRPLAVLTGIRRSLTDDGVYLAQEVRAATAHHENVDHPLGAFFYSVSVTHCMSVSLAQGGEGLGTMWGRQKAFEYMHTAGFGSVEVHELDHDIMNDYFVCRP